MTIGPPIGPQGDPSTVIDRTNEQHPDRALDEHAHRHHPPAMTTPRVTELPRRMAEIGADTFLGDAPLRPLAVVLPFRPRSARRRPRPARGAAIAHVVAPYGDDAA
jgi:hypothetical protein